MTSTTVVHHETPRAGLVLSTALSVLSIGVLAICLSQRVLNIKSWKKITLTRWLIVGIYIDSTLFVALTAILAHGFGLNTSQETCSIAILLCLVCYMSTKILIYYYLVEKVYIVNEVDTPRMKSKMYLFNCFGMLVPYCIVVVLNFVYRIATFNADGLCIIGMEKKAMMPLIVFDVVVNVYLTALFILPLRRLYSFNNPDSKLRTITFRTFIGSCTTLSSSVINLTILMVLKGEPAWICLMCCNFDILFSTVVLHWVTSKDSSKCKSGSDVTTGVDACGRCKQTIPTANFMNTFHQDKVFSGEKDTQPVISITSSAGEETKLVRNPTGTSAEYPAGSYGMPDFAIKERESEEKLAVKVSTQFDWRSDVGEERDERDESVASVETASWDKDVESGGDAWGHGRESQISEISKGGRRRFSVR